MKNILEYLEKSAELYPEKIAFSDPEGDISFSELVQKSEIIGSFFSDKLITGEPVVFYLEKSCLAIQGMFGAVYAGCFYSILDTRQPKARLDSIINVLNPKIIVTDNKNIDTAHSLFDDMECNIYSIEDIVSVAKINQEKLNFIFNNVIDTDPLYVNFTSGSTGAPKGVAVSHKNVIDFIDVFTNTFDINSSDVIGNQAPFDFDVSVKDIFSGISTGATVQIIPRDYFSNPMMLMDYLADRKITVLIWAVTAMCFVSVMNGFSYRMPGHIRKVMFSGEVMPIKQLNKWIKALPGVQFVNLYGPTEITCNCTYYILENREYNLDEEIPIGKAFNNEKVFLLDDNNKLITEPGQKGQIVVSGTSVALGYYKNPEITSKAFIQNPLNNMYYERVYCTGDLGAYLDDCHTLVYRGRKDFQIKYLGHRIELGEIESQVQARDGVSRACVLFDDKKKKLLLFYTGNADKNKLLYELKQVLPPFMIPNKVFMIENMPMTKNGKIDRNELRKIGGMSI